MQPTSANATLLGVAPTAVHTGGANDCDVWIDEQNADDLDWENPNGFDFDVVMFRLPNNGNGLLPRTYPAIRLPGGEIVTRSIEVRSPPATKHKPGDRVELHAGPP